MIQDGLSKAKYEYLKHLTDSKNLHFFSSWNVSYKKEINMQQRERISLLQEQEKTTTKVGTMVSFLKSSEEKDTVEDGEDCVECEVCHKKVSGFTLPEHLDWHYAVSVSKQSSNTTEISTTRAKQTDKRKREGPSGAGKKENSKKPRTTDISKFFTKS